MTWQTRSSLTPKVVSENQWQLHWLSVETESTHFQQAMQLYRRVRKKKYTRGIGTVLAPTIGPTHLLHLAYVMKSRMKSMPRIHSWSCSIQLHVDQVINLNNYPIVSFRVLRHFTLKASVTSVNAEANVHGADWLMSVFVNELAPPHVRSQQGQCVWQCRRI